MGAMSQQTKRTIFALILAGVIFIAVNWRNNKALPVALAALAVPIIIAVVSDRSPRFKALMMKIYMWFIIAVVVLGSIALLIYILRGDLDFGTSLLILLPLGLLLSLAFVVFYLGPILIKAGKIQAAENLYSFMLRLNPRFGFAYLQRGILRNNQKELDKALMDYDKALELAQAKAALKQKPSFSINYSPAVIHAYKANICLAKHDPQQAIAECNIGLTLNEAQPAINMMLQNRRGYAQLVSANYDGALQDLNSIRFEGKMTVYETSWSANLNALKALTLAGLSRMDEAKPLWQKAITLNPSYANPDWLRDTCFWPETLITLADAISHNS